MNLIKGKLYILLLSTLLSVCAIASVVNSELIVKLANQGNATAQFKLGYMYFQGEGVRQDYHKAKEWTGMAYDNGYQDGCDIYRKFNQSGI